MQIEEFLTSVSIPKSQLGKSLFGELMTVISADANGLQQWCKELPDFPFSHLLRQISCEDLHCDEMMAEMKKCRETTDISLLLIPDSEVSQGGMTKIRVRYLMKQDQGQSQAIGYQPPRIRLGDMKYLRRISSATHSYRPKLVSMTVLQCRVASTPSASTEEENT